MKTLSFILFILLTSCNSALITNTNTASNSTNKNFSDAYFKVKYEETSCRASWVSLKNDSETLKNLITFLKEKGISAKDAEISGKKQEMICMACSCKTGRTFIVKIKEPDLLKAEKEGFTKM